VAGGDLGVQAGGVKGGEKYERAGGAIKWDVVGTDGGRKNVRQKSCG